VQRRCVHGQAEFDQVVGDDAKGDPALHCIQSLVATAVQAMAALEQADAPLASGTPALGVAEPALSLERLALRTLGAAIGHGDTSDAALTCCCFVGCRRREACGGWPGCFECNLMAGISGSTSCGCASGVAPAPRRPSPVAAHRPGGGNSRQPWLDAPSLQACRDRARARTVCGCLPPWTFERARIKARELIHDPCDGPG